MPQPITGIPVRASDYPNGARVSDVQRQLRARGLRLVNTGRELLAVRIH